MTTVEKGNNIYEELIFKEEWCDIIKKKVKTSKFDLKNVSIGPLSEDQVGFMGDHLKLTASIRLQDGNQKKLQFFAKSKPMHNDAFREYVDTIKAFEKEIGFFANMLTDLNKYIIQSKEVLEEGDDASDTCFWTCECYLAKPDIIVLEDLFAAGYQHTAGRDPMDLDHCNLMLETLGIFHAASIIFEEKQPRTSACGKVTQIIDIYKDILFETEWVTTEGHPGNKYMKASIKGMVSMLEYLPNYGKNHENFKMIREKLPKTLEQMCEYVKPSTKYRNVICHGDLWINNVFFRYNNNKKPIKAKIVDFQLIRYNPPASEVMWFLHLVTRKDFRDANLDSFLTTYYKSFSTELRRHHLDPEQLLSWSEFKESCDYYRNAGRTAAALYFQQCMVTGDYLKTVFSHPDSMTMFQIVDKSKYMIECYNNDPVFRERNTEVVEELIEHCIVNK
ncbi:uncharacterized protein [Periplaneta americana]|uniref:uncharacterized protein n=1 Tax=Periplaneta americana TaxID=6978 RepID=UPI0037E703A9